MPSSSSFTRIRPLNSFESTLNSAPVVIVLLFYQYYPFKSNLDFRHRLKLIVLSEQISIHLRYPIRKLYSNED